MPVEYRIDAGKGRILTTCSGPVSFDEVIDHFRILKQDADLPPEPQVLLDFSDLDSFPSADQVQAVALEVRDLMPSVRWGRCGVVAPRDLAFGIGRMFEMISEQYFQGIMVFRSRDDAERWLETSESPG